VSTIDNRIDIIQSKCTSVQLSNITKVCVQNVLHVLEDVDATAWSLHRWTPGGNVPTHRSGMTSAGQHYASSCQASPTFGSLPGSGQDCWLATELEQQSLVFHKLTAARSHALWTGTLSCWNKQVTRQVVNGWQKLLMKQDISIILAVHLCTLTNEEQVGMPQTAHNNRHHHRSRERRTCSHNTTSLLDKWLQ